MKGPLFFNIADFIKQTLRLSSKYPKKISRYARAQKIRPVVEL